MPSSGKDGLRSVVDFNRENEMKLKNIYLHIGKKIVGEKFSVQENSRITITNLMKYFTGNENEQFNLNKGIFIYGEPGLGKSTIFAIIQKLLSWISVFDENGKRINSNGFMITSVEQIIENYKHDGNLDYFGYRKESKPIHLCINEFGKTVKDKIFGTDANQLIDSLFMIRYELFQKGYLTHVTSNYSPENIETNKLIADRIIEMFNIVEINGNSFRC